MIALRKELQEQFEKAHGIKLGFMSFFVKAARRGAQDASDRQRIGRRQRHHLSRLLRHRRRGVDGTRSGRAGAARRRQHELRGNREGDRGVREEGARRRAHARRPSGGTFTITNGGVFGSLLSTPIVNPPQSAILGMHTIQERADGGERPDRGRADDVPRAVATIIASSTARMRCSSWSTIKESLENPSRMLVGI